MDMTAHSLAPQLKTLRDEGMIILKDGYYELTNIGQILVKNMYPLFETIEILERNHRYWFTRNLSVIPSVLLEKIRDIGDYDLLEYDISEYMFDVPKEFSDNFKTSKRAMCLLSIYHPVYTDMQLKMAESGKEMTFIVTPKVYERLMEEEKERLKSVIQRGNVIFMKIEDSDMIYPSMTITDVFTYVYLFNIDGVYDNKIIVSTDKKTLSWIESLYAHYQNKSKRMENIA